MSFARCAICGHKIAALADRCPHCGETHQRRPGWGGQHEAGMEYAPHHDHRVACYQCGRSVTRLAQHCPGCGAPLQVQLTPASPHPVPAPSRPRGGRRSRVLIFNPMPA